MGPDYTFLSRVVPVVVTHMSRWSSGWSSHDFRVCRRVTRRVPNRARIGVLNCTLCYNVNLIGTRTLTFVFWIWVSTY